MLYYLRLPSSIQIYTEIGLKKKFVTRVDIYPRTHLEVSYCSNKNIKIHLIIINYTV